MSLSRFAPTRLRVDLPGQGWDPPINWTAGMAGLDTLANWQPKPGWDQSTVYYPGQDFYHPLAEPGSGFRWDGSWVLVRITESDHQRRKTYQSIKKKVKATDKRVSEMERKYGKKLDKAALDRIVAGHRSNQSQAHNDTEAVRQWQKKIADAEEEERRIREQMKADEENLLKKEEAAIASRKRKGFRKVQKSAKKSRKAAAKHRKMEAKLLAKGKDRKAEEARRKAEEAEERLEQFETLLGIMHSKNNTSPESPDEAKLGKFQQSLVRCRCLGITETMLDDETEMMRLLCGSNYEELVTCLQDCVKDDMKEESTTPDSILNLLLLADLEPDLLADAWLTLHPDLNGGGLENEDLDDDNLEDEDLDEEDSDEDFESDASDHTTLLAGEDLDQHDASMDDEKAVPYEDLFSLLTSPEVEASLLAHPKDYYRDISIQCKNSGFELAWNLESLVSAAGGSALTHGQSQDGDANIQKRDIGTEASNNDQAQPSFGWLIAIVAWWWALALGDKLAIITMLISLTTPIYTLVLIVAGNNFQRKVRMLEAREVTRFRNYHDAQMAEQEEAERAAGREMLEEMGVDGYRKHLEEKHQKKLKEKELDEELRRIHQEVHGGTAIDRHYKELGKTEKIQADLDWLTRPLMPDLSTAEAAAAVKRTAALMPTTLKSVVVHATAATVAALMGAATSSPATAVAQLTLPAPSA